MQSAALIAFLQRLFHLRRGRPLKEAKLPPQCLVVSIRRQNEMLFPRGSTIIEAGDVVTFLVSPSGEELLRTYLAERVEKIEPVLLD